jgi:AhpD family alkylhydroperoxidase
VSDSLYHPTTPAQARRRRELAPGIHEAFESFSKAVFAEGALDERTKQLIAVAVAHVTQCPYCIDGHTKLAIRKGASPEEVMEAIWVASEMRAGGAYAHATVALNAMDRVEINSRNGLAPGLGSDVTSLEGIDFHPPGP